MTRAIPAQLSLVYLLCHSTQLLAAANLTGAAVIAAGPVSITPTLGMEVEHRDNIYLQQRNTTDSWVYKARPAVNALVQDRENVYQLDYKGEAGWYQQSSNGNDNDYFDNTFSGDAHLEFSERWIAEAYLIWASLHEDRGTGLSEGLVGEFISKPIKYDQGDVGGSLQFGSDEGVGSLLLKAGYMDRQYTNFEDFTRSRDRDETTLSATFFHPVAPNTDILAEYAYKDIHYPNPFEDAPELDSDENSLLVGVMWEITPNMTSTARAGYLKKSFESSERKNWDGVAWSLELLMRPREQDTIVVRGSRQPEETTLQGDFIKREDVMATWTHDWSDRVYTELGALYGRDTYEQSVNDREDDIYNVTLRAGYEFRRWASVYVQYSYDDKDSNAQNLSYTDNVFTIGVELSL